MYRSLTGLLLCGLLSAPAVAADHMTKDLIQKVIEATDAAAMKRDAAEIGVYLGESFERVIDVPYLGAIEQARIGKMDYLQMIEQGWKDTTEYTTQRDDIKIMLLPDGISGESYSTITEKMVVDGVKMTSRFREYAVYELEDGRPVITEVSGHKLLGDTTPD